jgi:hypothetical protein
VFPQVERALETKLPGLTAMQADHIIVKGMSLRQRVTADKREARLNGTKLGPLYWDRIKQDYGLDNKKEKLKVKNPDEDVDKLLIQVKVQTFLSQSSNPFEFKLCRGQTSLSSNLFEFRPF